MFGVLEASAWPHRAHLSERFDLKKLLIGEGLVGAAKIGMAELVLRRRSLDEQVRSQQVSPHRIAIEKTSFLRIGILGVLPQQQIFLGELPAPVAEIGI